VVDNKLYVVGGRAADKGNAETFIMDLSVKNPKWTAGPSLPAPRWQHRGGVIDGVIYIVGGVVGDLSKENRTKPANDVLALDTKDLAKGWRQIAEVVSHKTEWFSGTVCGSKFYKFGGLQRICEKPKRAIEGAVLRVAENQFLPWVPVRESYSLDIKSGKWTKIKSLPTPKCSSGCVAIDERYILLAGGVELTAAGSETFDGYPRITFSNECWLYDTITDSYKAIQPLKKNSCDQGIAYVNGKVYVIGGEGSPWKTRTDLVQIGKFK